MNPESNQQKSDMAIYKTSSGNLVDTDKAVTGWDEGTRWDGSNQISLATGSQWDHETLHCSSRGNYYVVRSSQREGTPDYAEMKTDKEAAEWLLLNEHPLPDALTDLGNEISE